MSSVITEKLLYWKSFLQNYRLPNWEQIPNFGLYMEQVLVLLSEYLDYMPPELKAEQFVTAASINNYVRNKFMPKPDKKKYYRIHIAYLIMICSLKERLSISTIHKMIPVGIPEEQVKRIYDAYASKQRAAAEHFIDQVEEIASPILGTGEKQSGFSADSENDLISTSAIMSCLYGLFAEKLLYLRDLNEKKDAAE